MTRSRGSGREGLELFRHAPADLVITDIVMPEQDGLEVLMALRDTHPPVKIIAIFGDRAARGRDYLAVARAMGGEGAPKTVYQRHADRGGE